MPTDGVAAASLSSPHLELALVRLPYTQRLHVTDNSLLHVQPRSLIKERKTEAKRAGKCIKQAPGSRRSPINKKTNTIRRVFTAIWIV